MEKSSFSAVQVSGSNSIFWAGTQICVCVCVIKIYPKYPQKPLVQYNTDLIDLGDTFNIIKAIISGWSMHIKPIKPAFFMVELIPYSDLVQIWEDGIII